MLTTHARAKLEPVRAPAKSHNEKEQSMTNSPPQVFDLAGRIFGMGVLAAMRPTIRPGELPVAKVDEMANRIYCLGYLDALNHAHGGTQADRILAGEADGTQYAVYCRPDQNKALIFALSPSGEAARRFLRLAAAD